MVKTLKRDPKLLRKFLSVRAKFNSAQRKLKELRDELNLPEPSKETKGEYILTDKNHQLTAKYTIFFKEGFTVEDNWIGKIS